MLRGQLHRPQSWRSIGDFRSLAKNLKSERATTPAFPACLVGDLIAMTRKNLAISPL